MYYINYDSVKDATDFSDCAVISSQIYHQIDGNRCHHGELTKEDIYFAC